MAPPHPFRLPPPPTAARPLPFYPPLSQLPPMPFRRSRSESAATFVSRRVVNLQALPSVAYLPGSKGVKNEVDKQVEEGIEKEVKCKRKVEENGKVTRREISASTGERNEDDNGMGGKGTVVYKQSLKSEQDLGEEKTLGLDDNNCEGMREKSGGFCKEMQDEKEGESIRGEMVRNLGEFDIGMNRDVSECVGRRMGNVWRREDVQKEMRDIRMGEGLKKRSMSVGQNMWRRDVILREMKEEEEVKKSNVAGLFKIVQPPQEGDVVISEEETKNEQMPRNIQEKDVESRGRLQWSATVAQRRARARENLRTMEEQMFLDQVQERTVGERMRKCKEVCKRWKWGKFDDGEYLFAEEDLLDEAVRELVSED